MRTAITIILVLLHCGAVSPADAQDTTIVRGFVTDAATGVALTEATVAVLGTELASQTDASGLFQLEGLPLGAVTLSVLRMGYSPIQFTVDLDEAGTYQIAAGQIVLEPLPLQLDPVTVEGVPPPTRRPLTEFQLRREKSTGSFITREEFERMGNPTMPTDVLRRMRGVRVERNVSGMVDPGRRTSVWNLATNRWVVRMRRTAARAAFARAGGCPPLYFIDGRYAGTADQIDIDQVLSTNQIEAVEAYASAATIPIEFNRTGSVCGVIAFWTR